MDGDRVLVPDEAPGDWAVWVCRCRACGHPSVDVAPAETAPPFECSVCHEMAVYTDVRGAAAARALQE